MQFYEAMTVCCEHGINAKSQVFLFYVYVTFSQFILSIGKVAYNIVQLTEAALVLVGC